MIATLDRPELAPAAPTMHQASATWLQVMSDVHPRYGGMSAAVPDLSAALRERGIAAPIAALCRPAEQWVPAQIARADMHFLPSERSAWFLGTRSAHDLRRLVEASDGVHAHGLWTAASQAASKAARTAGRPFCISAHGMLEPWSLSQSRLRKQIYAALIERRVLASAACLHALTQSEADAYQTFAPGVPVAIVPNGVDVPEQSSAEKFFESFPALRGQRLMLFLGRLHPKKGLDLLLRVWPAIQAEHPEAHLVIAGVGAAEYEAQLRAQVNAEGVADSVTFTGLLQGELKWSALCAAECFVLPSHSEGLSVAVLEALGVGTPVLATRACNMPLLEADGCGWLADTDENSIGAALSRVLAQSPQQNERAGQRGAAVVRERYTWSVVAGQMAAVYRWLGGDSLPAGVEVRQ